MRLNAMGSAGVMLLFIASSGACAKPGCNSTAKSQGAQKNGATMAETLMLTDADQGASHAVVVGQDVTVRLSENPSTGYGWTLEADPANAVSLLGSEYVAGGTGPGAAGMREFHLQTKATGDVHLRLKLLRSWQGAGSAVQNREFLLHVAP